MTGRSTAQTAAWLLCLVALTMYAVAAGLTLLGWPAPLPPGFPAWPAQAVNVVGTAGAAVVGALLAARAASRMYAWVWTLVGFGLALVTFTGSYASFAVSHPGTLPGLALVALMGDLGWAITVGTVPFVLLLFPDGNLPSRRWRAVAWPAALAGGLGVVLALLLPDHGSIVPVARWSAFAGVDKGLSLAVMAGPLAVTMLALAASAVSVIARYRGGSQLRRLQIRWVAYAGAFYGASGMVLSVTDDLPGVWDAALEAVPLMALYVAVAVAVLRYRLYDIDLIINRTLVYGTLSAAVLVVYVAVVGALSVVFRASAGLPTTLLATAVVAVAFQPMRARAQRAVNRLLYGDRDEPHLVVSRLARRIEATPEPDAVLATIVAVTAQALRLPHASIWEVDSQSVRMLACHGRPPSHTDVIDGPACEALRESPRPLDVGAGNFLSALAAAGATLLLPLRHGAQLVGVLCVAPRAPGEAWSPADRAALTDLASHAGAAVHAIRLTLALRRSLEDLRRSHEQLVSSQEDERRRIQRDLHDGLGPTLAATRLHLEACLDLGTGAPPGLRSDLERIDELVQQAASDVRRLVQGLHPLALDQLGIVATLRQHVQQFARDTGIATRFDTGNDVNLTSPVDIAVFRIVQEALTNVAKHAGATQVDVDLAIRSDTLSLDVSDNGVGLTSAHRNGGSGLHTMRERAALVGGRLNVENRPGGGTLVTLRVPAAEDPSEI